MNRDFHLLCALLPVAFAVACGTASDLPPFASDPPSDAVAAVDAGSVGTRDLDAAAPAPLPTPVDASPPVVTPREDAGQADAAPPQDDPCPAAAELAPGVERRLTLTSGGVERSYVVHVGRGVRAGVPSALVVNFHGLNNSPDIQASFSGMDRLSDDKGFIVVYPQGISASFNGGGCCGTASRDGIDDLGFTRALVRDVSTKVCVDKKRVYATGFSNGGFMSHALGCQAADLFAAIAPVAGGNGMATCAPSRPVPVLAFHGTGDTVVDYATGQSAIAGWVTRNGCVGSPTRRTVGTSYCDAWTSCTAGAKVELCTITGFQHLWPGAGTAIPASPAVWAFFEQHTLP